MYVIRALREIFSRRPEEKQMEQYDDGGYGKPEERMETPKSGPSSMKFQHMLLVSWSLPNL